MTSAPILPPQRLHGLAGLTKKSGELAQGAALLVRSGVIAPMRPDRLLGVADAFRRWHLSLAFLYEAAARRYPDRAGLIDDVGSLTFREINHRTKRAASALAGHGVGPGTKVAVLCHNHRHLVETLVACCRLGADAVLMNTGLSRSQLTKVLADQQVELLVGDTMLLPVSGGAPDGMSMIEAFDEHGPSASPTGLEARIAEAAPTPPRNPGGPGRIIVLTSGTTGTPKGARRPEPKGYGPAAALLSRIPMRSNEKWLVCAPLFHTWGFAGFQISLLLASTMVLQRTFEPEGALQSLQQHQVEVMVAVPIMLQRLLEHVETTGARYDTSALRIVSTSGSALSGDLALRFQNTFGDVIYNLYGSTEVSWVTIAVPAELREAPGTAGRPPLGTDLAILDAQDRRLPRGEIGRIFVSNDMLFEGYTRGDTKNTVGALMSTGDLGYLDEQGRLFVSGRDDDMIVSGGENVFPRAVEDLLARRTDIADVAVVGVPDAEFGQRLAAFIVPAAAAEIQPEEIQSYVKEHLARFSVPREVLLLEELPRNATGKVLTRELASKVAQS